MFIPTEAPLYDGVLLVVLYKCQGSGWCPKRENEGKENAMAGCSKCKCWRERKRVSRKEEGKKEEKKKKKRRKKED